MSDPIDPTSVAQAFGVDREALGSDLTTRAQMEAAALRPDPIDRAVLLTWLREIERTGRRPVAVLHVDQLIAFVEQMPPVEPPVEASCDPSGAGDPSTQGSSSPTSS